MIKFIQTYGFLMAMRSGGCSDTVFEELLKHTEAFLLRRHICRERGNDTEALFARLCRTDPSNPIPKVITEFRAMCPDDAKFRLAFESFEFSSSLIDRARYCLEQIESKSHGNYSELHVGGSDTVQVEHIMPIKIKTKKAKDEYGDWPAYLGPDSEAMHRVFVSRIGNLTLFAGKLNISASNNPYERKKEAYIKSAIEMTRQLPRDYQEFRFEQITERSKKFASIAVNLWPKP